VNGFLVTKVRINAVIATIGVGTMMTGLGFSYSAFPIAIGIPRAFTEISLARASGVPNPVFITAALLDRHVDHPQQDRSGPADAGGRQQH
jgi:ribose transport system permease protein